MAKMIATVSMIPRMLRSLRCPDGDDEQEQRERQKTATRTATVTGLDKQKNNFAVPNMFYRERKQTTTNFSF